MKVSLMKKFVVGFLLLLAISALCTFAGNNTLNSIEISSKADKYKIVFNTTDITKVKRIIDSNDRITLELKGVKQADTLVTSYQNAPNIESVVILPSSGNDIKVLINGHNIVNSVIKFDTKNHVIGSAIKQDINGKTVSISPVMFLKNNVRFDYLMYFSAFALLIIFAMRVSSKRVGYRTISQREKEIQNRLVQADFYNKHRILEQRNGVNAYRYTNPYRYANPAQRSRLDNIRFMESMQKVYERNGRNDLAREFQSNVKRVKVAQYR